MESLMVKLEDDNYIPRELCSINRFEEVDDYDSCSGYCELHDSDCSKCAIQQCFNRLAEYDDLNNKCIKDNLCDLRMLLQKWKEFINDIHNLYEYRELEKQGKLLKPKCLPGDYVWEVNKERNIISEYEVTSIRYGINKTFRYIWTLREGIYGDLDGFRDDKIGKTVFLTKSEAELALQKINETKDSD